MKPRIGTHVTLNMEQLTPGYQRYWTEHGGDLAGVVTLRNGGRCQVTFANGRQGWFDDGDLLAEAEQGVLFA